MTTWQNVSMEEKMQKYKYRVAKVVTNDYSSSQLVTVSGQDNYEECKTGSGRQIYLSWKHSCTLVTKSVAGFPKSHPPSANR